MSNYYTIDNECDTNSTSGQLFIFFGAEVGKVNFKCVEKKVIMWCTFSLVKLS